MRTKAMRSLDIKIYGKKGALTEARFIQIIIEGYGEFVEMYE